MGTTTTDATTIETEPELSEDETPADDEPEVEQDLSLNVVYDILKNTRRRRVLHLLHEDEEGSTLGDLAERIAAIENDKPRAQLNAQERKRVYVGLYQCHLPRMDDADVIEFDDNRGTVELGEHASQVYQHLESAEVDDDSTNWPAYYATYGLGGLVVATALAVVAPTVVSMAAVAVLLAGVVALAAYHGRREQV